MSNACLYDQIINFVWRMQTQEATLEGVLSVQAHEARR